MFVRIIDRFIGIQLSPHSKRIFIGKSHESTGRLPVLLLQAALDKAPGAFEALELLPAVFCLPKLL